MNEPTNALTTTSIDLSSSNGYDWTLSCTDDPSNVNVLPLGHSIHASVPGNLYCDISHLIPDPFLSDNNLSSVFSDLEKASFSYTCNFSLPFSHIEHNIQLTFDALDTVTIVYLNDRCLFTAENAFHPHSVFLLPSDVLTGTQNVLRVDFKSIHSVIEKRSSHTYREWNDPVGGISRVRTPQYVAGWDWGPRLLGCGITGPVRLTIIPFSRIIDVAYVQHFHVHNDDYTSVKVDVQVVVNIAIKKDMQVKYDIIANLLYMEDEMDEANNKQESTLKCMCTRVEKTNDEEGKQLWDGDMKVENEIDSNFQLVQYEGIIHVNNPQLWWPNGMGPQNLYSARISVVCCNDNDDNNEIVLDTKSTKIGLRDLKLLRQVTSDDIKMHQAPCFSKKPITRTNVKKSDDEKLCESFTFCVNGRRFFAKGSNYIPLHVNYVSVTYDDYVDIVSSAREAHMNMLRVWGGGIYESSEFYNLCDQYGLLLWHDFMFSCSLYPGDDSFLSSCEREAKFQTSRLRNHACMALWCGNNELEQVPNDILQNEDSKLAYEQLFYQILNNVVINDIGTIPYWPCSPHNPKGYEHGFNNPCAGDTHFWDVWHARQPVTAYMKHESRFCSEFGMQSYMSENGTRSFLVSKNEKEKERLNIFDSIFESHQKNANGNLIILEYCQRLFQMAKNFACLAYQSQLNQWICMRIGVEHFRRSWPYCSGALYWQLNDCWPCFSWSSIEYGGNWKALHYGAKLFYAPLLISIIHHGTMMHYETGICNLIKLEDEKRRGVFSIYATYDGIEKKIECKLTWKVMNLRYDKIVSHGEKDDILLERDTSTQIDRIDTNIKDGKMHILHTKLESKCGTYTSDSTGWFCSPRLCDLAHDVNVKISIVDHAITVKNDKHKNTRTKLEVVSDRFSPFTEIWMTQEYEKNRTTYVCPTRVKMSRNFIDLYPGERSEIDVEIDDEIGRDELEKRLQWRTLTGSYADS